MKKKFSLWINLAVICLCVCSIAIGVYAATSATLTISGQIGFEAHGLTYTASAKAKGYATDPDDASTYKSEYQTFDNLTNNKITLDDMYFTDLVGETVPTIEIQISITNGSLFPVEAMLSLPETNLLQTNITFDVENGLAQMGDTNDTDTKTQTITIIMTLNNAETTDLEELQGLNFTISLSKLAKIKGDSTNGYYMTMGSNVVTRNNIQQVQPVKWLPFAESSDGTTWTAFDNTNKPDNSKQYYFISEKVLDVGTVTVDDFHAAGTIANGCGVSYNNDFNSLFNSNIYTSLSANNYLASNIRKILKGEDVYKGYTSINGDFNPSGEKVNLINDYGIKGYLYEKISLRTAEELYEIDANGITYDNIPSELKTSDSLWVLDDDEIRLLLDNEEFSMSYEEDARLKTPTFKAEADNTYWWLRFPNTTEDYDYSGRCVHCVVGENLIVPIIYIEGLYGIRPAFQFDLSK